MLRIKPLIGKPVFIKKGVTLVAKETTNGLWIIEKRNRALFKDAVDLYANAIWVLSKDRLMLTFIRITNIGSKS